MSWPDEERYLRPLQSLVVYLLFISVSTLVFSQTGGVLSHRSSSTRRFPRFSPRNLCSLVTLAVFSLVFDATEIAYCWALIPLGLAESRILPAAPVDTRPRTLLISFCTVQLRTLCAAHSLATLCLSTTSGPGRGELPGFWGSMVFCHAPIHRKGSCNKNTRMIGCKIVCHFSANLINIVSRCSLTNLMKCQNCLKYCKSNLNSQNNSKFW